MAVNNEDNFDLHMDVRDGNSRVREREDDVSKNRRNLRQHLEEEEIFRPAFERNVSLGMHNVNVVRNETAGVATRRPFNPTSVLIPLSTLLSVGSNHGTNLILIIINLISYRE